MAEWHPIQAAKQSGPNEWQIWSARNSDFPKGVILRVEFGLYREAWFRAVITVGPSGGKEVLGWCRSAERAAELIWAVPQLDSHTKPFPGYPVHRPPRTPPPRTPPPRAPTHAAPGDRRSERR